MKISVPFLKKITLLSCICFLFTVTVSAQETITFPDDLVGWQPAWSVGLSGSQASYSNWAQGGVNNIAATGRTTFTTVYQKGKSSYGFLIDARYGKTKVENEGVRKIDDRFLIKNRLLYELGEDDSDFQIFGNVRMRTQFDDGYDYGNGPDGSDLKISSFMAPAYFTQDAGLAYIPSENFSVELGLGLKQTFVRDTELSTLYGLAEGERFQSEAGFTIGSSLKTDIATNVTYSTSLNTFTSFNKALKSTDVNFSNTLTGKINDFLNTSLSLDFVYDDDFTSELQVAQVLSLGVVFNIK